MIYVFIDYDDDDDDDEDGGGADEERYYFSNDVSNGDDVDYRRSK